MRLSRLRRSTTLVAALTLALLPAAQAAEGMWTFDNLPHDLLKKTWSFAPDKAWLDKVMHASARLAGGCSSSFISTDGLVLTNHHCAEGCISQLSTPEKDLRHLGFLAKTREAEAKCPGMELNRLEQITDVTAEFAKATAGKTGKDYTDAVNATRARIESACVGDDKKTLRCDVVSLYQGGLRHLYKYHRFSDVRLAFAPEVEIGAFGGDPDNFDFPRYDLDMSLLRAYEDGKPAKTPDFFAWNAKGVEDGELVMTSGNPGSTQRKLTVAQLEVLRDVDMPNRLLRLSETRGLLTQYATEGKEQDRLAQEELRWLENSYKAIYGELEALRDPAVFAKKRSDEQALKAFAAKTPALKDSLSAWDDIAKAEAVYRDMQLQMRYTEQAQGFWTDYFGIARSLVRAADERSKPNGERLPEFTDAGIPRLEARLFDDSPIYPAIETVKLTWSLGKLREHMGADDALVKKVLGRESPAALANRWVSTTQLGSVDARRKLWEGGKAAILASDDPFIKLALAVDGESRATRKRAETEIQAVVTKAAERIAKVRFAQLGTKVYPDATFSLRLSFGEVKGFKKNGQNVGPFTETAGLYDRATGFDPFKLPASWVGAQKDLNPKQRFNFTATNDIIGGNSGSPMINRKAELVGLVFDGNLDSLGGAFWYDERVNRSVGVHAGIILEALDKVYHADSIVSEIKAGAVK